MSLCYSDKLIDFDINDYDACTNLLYSIFKTSVHNAIKINGKDVKVREYPPEGKDKEEAFYHLTETDYRGETETRYLDPNRCRRMLLIKPIIENVNVCPNCSVSQEECSQILLWKEAFKKTFRYYLFLPDMSYIVILEDRKTYYLLVTAFYVYPEQFEKYYERYQLYSIDAI